MSTVGLRWFIPAKRGEWWRTWAIKIWCKQYQWKWSKNEHWTWGTACQAWAGYQFQGILWFDKVTVPKPQIISVMLLHCSISWTTENAQIPHTNTIIILLFIILTQHTLHSGVKSLSALVLREWKWMNISNRILHAMSAHWNTTALIIYVEWMHTSVSHCAFLSALYLFSLMHLIITRQYIYEVRKMEGRPLLTFTSTFGCIIVFLWVTIAWHMGSISSLSFSAAGKPVFR